VDGEVSSGNEPLPLIIDVFDLSNDVWRPEMTDGAAATEPGIVLTRAAADDLGVGAGETVSHRHPQLQATGEVAIVETELPVVAIHEHRFRFVAYVDIAHAALFGAEGLANFAMVEPAAGADPDAVRRALFETPGVVSAQPASVTVETFRDVLGQAAAVLRVVAVVVLVLAVLIAFNSASISSDERARENATMFAYGVPVRRVMLLLVAENAILGAVSTAAGMVVGWAILSWMANFLIPNTMPDLSVVLAISPATLGIALVLGIVGVAAAPLLTWRKLARQDIPATLKVMA
jgi:putative ABC transport system permease protein